MNIELVQLTVRDGNIGYNLKKACEAINSANDSTDLIIFPDTYLTGFPTKENIARIAEPLTGSFLMEIHRIASLKNIAVIIGLSESNQGKYYNTAVLITPEDGILAYYRKTHLWEADKDIFSAGDRFISINYKGVRLSFLISFDIEFPEAARAIAELDTELLIVLNSNMDPYGATHRVAIMARAQENQYYAVMVNRVGTGDDFLTFAGGSCVVNPAGEMVCEAGREPCKLVINIDPKQNKEYHDVYHYMKERRLNISGKKVIHKNGRYDWLIN